MECTHVPEKNDYTIPRKIRELQFGSLYGVFVIIIPYQEKLGNYNWNFALSCFPSIIPYQEKLGNYNIKEAGYKSFILYHTKKN